MRALSCCFRFDKREEEGIHDRERIGIESGEGDDEHKGHTFEVNVNQCSGAPSPRTHCSRSLDADVSVIDLSLGVGTYGPNVGEMVIRW